MTELTPTTPDPPSDPLAITAFACAAFALGQAILVRDGEYWPAAIYWLSASIALTLIGVLSPQPLRGLLGRRCAVRVVACLVLIQILQMLTVPPSGRNPWSNDLRAGTSLVPFRVGVAVAALLVLALLRDQSAWRRAAIPLLLATHFLLGVWLIRSAPDPHIDVHVFQQEGAKALLEGRNPYTADFPDIYRGGAGGAGGTRAVYGDDLTEGGRVHFGFPYLPLSLFLALPGYVLAGDHRYAQLAAMTLAGALLAYARPGRCAALAAALLLFTPRGFFVLGRGWTEPFTVVLLALVVHLASKRGAPTGLPRASRSLAEWGLPLSIGLFLASKQYLVLATPLVWFLLPRPIAARSATVFLGRAILAGLLVTLPLVLLDVRAFWRSTVTVQVLAPYRTDALSFHNYWLHKRGLLPADGSLPPAGVIPPAWPALAAALLMLALAGWRADRWAAGFAGAAALVFFVFIALNKQAFANYYHFVIAALCCAVAAHGVRVGPVPPGDARSL